MGKKPYMPLMMGDWTMGTRTFSSKKKGVFLDLLVEQYDKGFIPADLTELSRINNEVVDVWSSLREKFVEFEPGKLQNAKLEQVRAFFNKQQSNGKLGGRPKKKPKHNPNNNPNTNLHNEYEYDHEFNLDLKEEGGLGEEGNMEVWPIFEYFWETYDKKRSKTKAEKLWESLKQDQKEAIMEYLPHYLTATPDKQYRKDPDVFLRNECWNDEIIEPKQNGSKQKGFVSYAANELASDPDYKKL